MKKMLSIIITFALAISMTNFALATGSNLGPVETYSQDVSVELLDDFLSNYNDSMYGGAYIGDNGQLVVNLLEENEQQQEFINEKNTEMKKMRFSTDELSKIDVTYVEYSMEFLKKILDKLYPYMSELGIIGMGIDEMNNRIVIDAKPEFSEIEMKLKLTTEMEKEINLESEKSNYQISYLADYELFEINRLNGTLEDTASVKAGTKVWEDSDFPFTVAWGALIEFSGEHKGKNVFLVPGHAVEVGDTVKIGNTTLGKVIVKHYGGIYDFAYVENAGNTFTSKLPNGENLPVTSAYSNPPQNLSVTAYGSVSGKQTGKILLTNYQGVDSNGVSYYGMLKTSYKAIKGDSGGPVWSGSPVGMQSRAYLVYGEWDEDESFTTCTVLANLCNRYSTYDIFIQTF